MTTKQPPPATFKLDALMHDYVLGKDGNRPVYMARVFDRDAVVNIRLNTDTISFPAELRGLDMISKVLVREFNERYENIFTFYLDRPAEFQENFSCGWLVAMTEIATGRVRIGCGQFEWHVQKDRSYVTGLTITIDSMLALEAGKSGRLYAWLLDQPYPWADVNRLQNTWPQIPELEVLRDRLRDHASRASSLE